MNKIIISILLVVCSAPASDDKKPVIYNHAAKETTDIDRQVAGLFAPKFTIVDIHDDTSYLPAKPTEAPVTTWLKVPLLYGNSSATLASCCALLP